MLFALKAAAFLLSCLPLGLSITIGRLLGRAAYRLDKKRGGIARENLRNAFGGKLSEREIDGIAGKVFENLAIMFFEFVRIPWLKPSGIGMYIECEGIEHLKNALAKKKGVIICTAHFGNWELLAAYFGLSGHPMDIVAREIDNRSLDEFVNWVRTRCGNRVISKGRAMRKLLRRLSENAVVGILLDQNVTHSEGVFVDFFGTPACTNKGPALLAAASGAAVVPAFIIRKGKKHMMIFREEVKMSNTGDKERDALENTARCTKVIEDMIRKYPHEWFWVHRRWKTRPLK